MTVKLHLMWLELKGSAMLPVQLRYSSSYSSFDHISISISTSISTISGGNDRWVFAFVGHYYYAIVLSCVFNVMLLRVISAYFLVGCESFMGQVFLNYLLLNCFQEKCEYAFIWVLRTVEVFLFKQRLQDLSLIHQCGRFNL